MKIFQNWEALGISYPGFFEGIICKFVNASTADGYNPYRVTRDGTYRCKCELRKGETPQSGQVGLPPLELIPNLVHHTSPDEDTLKAAHPYNEGAPPGSLSPTTTRFPAGKTSRHYWAGKATEPPRSTTTSSKAGCPMSCRPSPFGSSCGSSPGALRCRWTPRCEC